MHRLSTAPADAVLDLIRRHRSIRAYRPDPIPDDLLTELLEAGVRASPSRNMQTYLIVATRDRAAGL